MLFPAVDVLLAVGRGDCLFKNDISVGQQTIRAKSL